MDDSTPLRDLVRRGLERLGIDSLVLSIFDASFPSRPDEDAGRGSPYTRGGHDLVRWAAGLGFNGLLLGPQGQTTPGNRSPYDGALFSRSSASLGLWSLAHDPAYGGVLSTDLLASIVAARPADDGRPHHGEAEAAKAIAIQAMWRALHDDAPGEAGRARRDLRARARAFAEARPWLIDDALFEALAAEHRTHDPRRWPAQDRDLHAPSADAAARAARRAALRAAHGEAVARWALVQCVLDEQHQAFRAATRSAGMRLFGDLQAGLSLRDAWRERAVLLDGYLLGAPPSRTNPEGQPWGYAVVDPDAAEGKRFLAARYDAIIDHYDGVRIDHPHALVCPWVYRADDPDAHRAVRAGARLHESPDLPDHPALARLAIVGPEQLDRSLPRHADLWVRDLTPAQVERYAAAFDLLVARVRRRGGDPLADIACEVLSTCPLPLRRVLERHALGRFRVTQKLDPANPDDPYRSDRAAPADWIMVGTHDTATIWQAVEGWAGRGEAEARAAYYAGRLCPREGERAALARALAADPRRLAQAALADVFVGPARNVIVFVGDLLGWRQQFNVPGTVRDENWSLRVPADFAARFTRDVAQGAAMDVAGAVATALRARFADDEAAALAAALARRGVAA